MPASSHPIVIVGAGIAGLTVARELTRLGHAPLVVERSKGVGGRCATRRVGGQPVDHGVFFIHAQSAALRRELDAVEAMPLPGWPVRTDGEGTPCRPDAFSPAGYRVAFAEGVNVFAKHLARGLHVRTESPIASLSAPSAAMSGWQLRTTDGETFDARTLVFALPPANVRDLLATADPLPLPVAGLPPLLDLAPSVPCATVIATYNADRPRPAWDVSYPAATSCIQSIGHDSSKRAPGASLALVIQARAAWSRAALQQPADVWATALLEEAGRLHGTWMGQPASFQGHAWRKARVAPGSELSQPVLLDLGAGVRLGCAGDAFHPAGGVEGAYLSGLLLAQRLHHALATAV